MRLGAGATPVNVLLVEDSPSDVEFTTEALKESKLYINLDVVSDGVEALAFLRREGKYADAPRPNLVLLDLNLPRKGGLEVLEDIRADEDLKRLAVVILTTSSAEQDIITSYDLHANCYVTKPVDMAGFVRVVNAIQDFWFTVVQVSPE